MFRSDLKKLERNSYKFKREVTERSKNWGKQKFKPKPFGHAAPAPIEQEAKPWHHVKNEILDDERTTGRFDMHSQNAKEMVKQREQNYRRNIIETGRSEKPKWESFDDNETTTKTLNTADRIMQDPKNLSFKERNFLRRKLTKAVMNEKTSSLKNAIEDLQHNSRLVRSTNKFRK
ncbi:uncharacterized protein LOC6575783 [Drosophila mojavensis]|uniref:Uncharacterized protein n=1 Tax=Drosophila mojavensis TaxID=7230 RepID=B4KHG5_DROMO|nr:uncharacterized protein LOC6575783 [Drosophila mojavensis]EDW11229.1 uncharacterized protein Dmoj_GI17034 [Drosophila mojavensis]